MRRVLKGVETDAANPLRYQPGVLSRGEMRFRVAATGKQALPCIPTAGPQIVVHRLPCDFRQLEPHGRTSLPLANVGAVDRIAVGRRVVDAQSNEIAAAQFAVYGEVEEGQVACTPFQLQLGMDQPHVPGPERLPGCETFQLGMVATTP